MRKESRAMDSLWALEVMHKAPYITVSFIDEDGKPYGLPFTCIRWWCELVFSWCLGRQKTGGNQGSSWGLPFSRNPLCAYGWSEGRQFHPAIQISHCIRQGRNRDRWSREDSWSPANLWTFPSSTHGCFRPEHRPFPFTHGCCSHHAYWATNRQTQVVW